MTGIPSLKSHFAFAIGAAIAPDNLKTHDDLLPYHFGSITPENAMKFELIHPHPEQYRFEAADAIVAYALKHHMRVRGHTLVWHNQTPNWVFEDASGESVSRDALLATMKSHIDTVAGRYRHKVYAWDVVNEAISDEGEERLRSSKWRSAIGDDFIAQAFYYAHQADTDAVLFYNDYNECFPQKRDKIVSLVKDLIQDKVPVHGIGMQGHWNMESPTLEQIQEAIEAYATLGLQIQITELDLSMFAFNDKRTDLQHPTQQMLDMQATRYHDVFALLKSYDRYISGITFWGIADDYTWLDNFPVRGRKNWPMLFDAQHAPKAAFWEVINS